MNHCISYMFHIVYHLSRFIKDRQLLKWSPELLHNCVFYEYMKTKKHDHIIKRFRCMCNNSDFTTVCQHPLDNPYITRSCHLNQCELMCMPLLQVNTHIMVVIFIVTSAGSAGAVGLARALQPACGCQAAHPATQARLACLPPPAPARGSPVLRTRGNRPPATLPVIDISPTHMSRQETTSVCR